MYRRQPDHLREGTAFESESEVAQSCPALCHPRDCSLPQASLSTGSSRQEYWSGLPFPSPGDLLDPGIEPRSSTWRQTLYPLRHLELALWNSLGIIDPVSPEEWMGFIYFLLHLKACGLSVPPPGTEPRPVQWNLNHWTTREVPQWVSKDGFPFRQGHFKQRLLPGM